MDFDEAVQDSKREKIISIFPPHIQYMFKNLYNMQLENNKYSNKIQNQIINFKKGILRTEISMAFNNKQKVITSNNQLSLLLEKIVPENLSSDFLNRMNRIFESNKNNQLRIMNNKFNLHYDRF